VHCDFNEFNIMCDENGDVTIIDFPQMVSCNHPNAEDLFVRDLKCLHKFFLRRYDYRASEDENGVPDPNFFDVANGGVGHGAGQEVEKSLDVSLRASGFTAAAGKDLDAYNAARIEQKRKETTVNDANDADTDTEDEDEDDGTELGDDSSDSDESVEGQRGGDERSRFGYVERGEEEVEEAEDDDDDDDDDDDAIEDPEADAAAEAALARLYGHGSSAPGVPTIDEEEALEPEGDTSEEEEASSEDEGEGRRSKKWARAAAAEAAAAKASGSSRAADDGTRSVGRSSMFSTRSRADIGNDPDLVRSKLKKQAAGKKTKLGAVKPAGTRNHTKDRGGKRGAKGHQFKYDGYGGQVTL
jgi:hypothetical protein